MYDFCVDNDVYERRRWWAEKEANERGRDNLAQALGYSDTNYLNQVVTGHTPLGNKNAKKWAEKLGRPSDYFDQRIPLDNEGDPETPEEQPVDLTDLRRLFTQLGPERFAEEVALMAGDASPKDYIQIAQYFLDRAEAGL